MAAIDGLRERVEIARREYAALPADGWGPLGRLDERTGERWDRGHVLGHVAEAVPFWMGQIRAVLDGTTGFVGRDEVGGAQRRTGIDSGREAGEAGLLRRIDAALLALQAMLADLREADLDRRVVFRSAQGDRESDLLLLIDQLLVGHVEDHLKQISESDG
ncbi:MAG TPA: DinB family protein [Candidatus Dormibacteraeota bacterium]